MLVTDFLLQSTQDYASKLALVTEEGRFTYSELDDMSNQIAYALISLGVKKGDRIVIFLDNCLEAVVSIFGILKAGAVFSVINYTTKANKLQFMLNNCQAKVLISHRDKLPLIHSIIGNTPHLAGIILKEKNKSGVKRPVLSFKDIFSNHSIQGSHESIIDIDLAALIYTSGTTGNPKGVMLTHLNMVAAATSITQYLENINSDIILNVLPLSFDYGLYQILMGFKIGGTVVLEKSLNYPYEIIKKLVNEKVTGFPIVPTIASILLQLKDLSKFDFNHLRYISNTAAHLPTAHIMKLQQIFPKTKIYLMYGLTECKRVSYLPPDQLVNRPNSVGKAMPNIEVYIVDSSGKRVKSGEIGELVVRGSNVMQGYWQMPEETKLMLKAGKYPWEKILYTGDLFKMDQEGYLYFVARKDDIIKCKGEKVSPKEIENILYMMSEIAEAAVVGVEDNIFGQAIKAYVFPSDGKILDEHKIRQHCCQHLEDYMIPSFIEIVNSLPKTDSGKIKKTVIN
jgi:long-chain acyl-CoA synthetase